VRWYITYRLSYRDLQAMMAERGIVVSHSTILRWVSRYVPEFEKRFNRFARPVNTSWRVDTCINIRGKNFLYRAVDKHGKTLDFLLRPDRGIAAAQAFFRKALSSSLLRWPAQDHARWPLTEPHGPSASAARRSEMEVYAARFIQHLA
jgi:transposase-like protein